MVEPVQVGAKNRSKAQQDAPQTSEVCGGAQPVSQYNRKGLGTS